MYKKKKNDTGLEPNLSILVFRKLNAEKTMFQKIQRAQLKKR